MISVELPLDAVDDVERVVPVTHLDGAHDRVAVAVEVHGTAADVGSQRHVADVAHQNGGAVHVRAHRHVLEIGDVLDVADSLHHVLGFRVLHDAAADVVVAASNRADDLAERQIVGEQPVRIDVHLVLPDETTNHRDVGNAGHGLELVADVPVLQAAELREIVLPGMIHQRVLKDPADRCRVGPEHWRDPRGQLVLDEAQVLEDAAARPVDVRAVLEDHVDERETEERIAAHDLGVRHRQHRGRDRVGHLVFDDLRRLAGPLGEDDDLHVADIGERVHRDVAKGVHPAGDGGRREEQDQHLIADRAFNNSLEHDPTPVAHATASRRTIGVV